MMDKLYSKVTMVLTLLPASEKGIKTLRKCVVISKENTDARNIYKNIFASNLSSLTSIYKLCSHFKCITTLKLKCISRFRTIWFSIWYCSSSKNLDSNSFLYLPSDIILFLRFTMADFNKAML